MKLPILALFSALLLSTAAQAEVTPGKMPVANFEVAFDVNAIDPALVQMGLDKFLELTPAQYKEVTGKRLGLKNSIALKAAQKQLKQEMRDADLLASPGDGITKGIYILLAIFGLAWIAMGLKSDWEGSDWIVNLVLTLICWLPGLIHALVKMKDYYSN